MDSLITLAGGAIVLSLLVMGIGTIVKDLIPVVLFVHLFCPSLLTAWTTKFTNAVTSLEETVATTVADVATNVSAVEKLIDERQLVVVASDHWLLDVVCQAKRIEHHAWITKQEQETMTTTTKPNETTAERLQERKRTYLSELLDEIKQHHTPIGSNDDTKELSERVVRLASVFSALLPAYEPLLVEVALVHCLHEWSSSNDLRAYSADDSEGDEVVDFEAYLLTQLQIEEARNWFNCQFFIDSLDLLCMTPLFYKQRIHNQALKDVISISIVEARGDAESFYEQMISQLVEEKNEAALRAWNAWLGEEIATVGVPRRETTASAAATSLVFLREKLMNATQLDPQKRGYFPNCLEIQAGFCSTVFHDLSGVIITEEDDTSVHYAGFIYHGGRLPDQIVADSAKQEERQQDEKDGSFEMVENDHSSGDES